MIVRRSILVAVVATAATPALAHSEAYAFSGLAAGFLHPFSGMDHVLAMLAVGLFASALGGRAFWAVPASSLLMILAGGVLGSAGVAIPGAEAGIVVSVVVLGAILASGRSWPVGAAMGIVGLFGVFHGYAHGAEMPLGATAFPYSFGFFLASAALHLVGIGTGHVIGKNGLALRSSGAIVTLAGVALALG